MEKERAAFFFSSFGRGSRGRKKQKNWAPLDASTLDVVRQRFFASLFLSLNRCFFFFPFTMAGSRLPPLPRGGGGSGAALAAREQQQRENNNNSDAAGASFSQEPPFSRAMLAAGDDVMGLGFSCTGFDALGAPADGGGARAASTQVVADWDANAGGASRRRGKVID